MLSLLVLVSKSKYFVISYIANGCIFLFLFTCVTVQWPT